jgi:hypothetical protein
VELPSSFESSAGKRRRLLQGRTVHARVQRLPMRLLSTHGHAKPLHLLLATYARAPPRCESFWMDTSAAPIQDLS